MNHAEKVAAKIRCRLEGHDWHRPTKDNGNRSGHKKCWRCGENKRSKVGG